MTDEPDPDEKRPFCAIPRDERPLKDNTSEPHQPLDMEADPNRLFGKPLWEKTKEDKL